MPVGEKPNQRAETVALGVRELERVSLEGEDYRPCGDHNVVWPRPLMFSSWRVFPGTKRPGSHRGWSPSGAH